MWCHPGGIWWSHVQPPLQSCRPVFSGHVQSGPALATSATAVRWWHVWLSCQTWQEIDWNTEQSLPGGCHAHVAKAEDMGTLWDLIDTHRKCLAVNASVCYMTPWCLCEFSSDPADQRVCPDMSMEELIYQSGTDLQSFATRLQERAIDSPHQS